MKKSKLKKVLLNSLIVMFLIVGIALIFNKQLESFWLNWVGQQKVTTISKAEVKKGNKQKGKYDASAVKALSLDAMLAAQKAKHSYAIGIISIPKVSIGLPIYKGMTNNTLAIGAGTMKPNQKMGVKNYALAGHHMEDPNVLFSPLSRISIHDYIYLTDMEKVYIYQVTDKQIIPQTKGDIIDDHDDKKELTLITCASGNPGETRRIAVIGNFVKSKKLTKKQYKKYFNF